MTFLGTKGPGGSPLATFEEFQCSARIPAGSTTTRLLVKPDGLPAELRPAQNNYLYSVKVFSTIFGDDTLNRHNQKESTGIAFWNGTAWTHTPSGSGIYTLDGWEQGPTTGMGPSVDFEIDGGVGIIQILGSLNGTENHYQHARVQIFGAPFDASNFPDALTHI